MPQDAFERAVIALSRRGESATARVFAARRALGEGQRFRDALATHARRQSRLCFEPPPACDRDVRRLCRAAREQGHTVDPDAVLAEAVADTRATVLERARAVRDASGLSPSERERRLTDLLDAARAAGFEVQRADVFGEARAEGRDTSCSDGEGDTASESREVEEGADADTERPPEGQSDDARSDVEDAVAALTTKSGGGSTDEVDVPDPETISSWLVGAGQNSIADWP